MRGAASRDPSVDRHARWPSCLVCCGIALSACTDAVVPSAGGSPRGAPDPTPLEAVARYTLAVEAPAPPATEAEARARAAGAGGGSFQITLTWENRNDLDLHLLTPCGDRVYHRSPTGCGTIQLDVDMNVSPESDTPVEHINAELANLPSGAYEIHVVRFANHVGSASDDYAVELRLGDEVKTFPGRITDQDRARGVDRPSVAVTSFEIP